MKKTILKITAFILFAAAMVATSGRAQDAMSTNAPAAADQTSVQNTNAPVKKHRKHEHPVFNGKLVAVDTNAMTLTVGKRTFEITSDTKIFKDGKPATLSDGVAGEMIGGTYKKEAYGKLTATSIRFGEKTDGEKKKKKKASPDDMNGSTNSVPN